MLNNHFTHLAQKTLLYIADKIESQDLQGQIDVELQEGILKLAQENKIFIINKNSAAKEIWLSSPISGPSHFTYYNGEWETKTGTNLFSLLAEELNIDFDNRSND